MPIKINPPVTKDYAPATQPIAGVAVFVQGIDSPGANGGAPPPSLRNLSVTLLNAAGQPIPYDRSQIPAMTAAQIATFESAPAVAGDSFSADFDRRALPYLLAAFGLTGVVS